MVPKLIEREIIQCAHEMGNLSVRKTIHAVQQQFFSAHQYKVIKSISIK